MLASLQILKRPDGSKTVLEFALTYGRQTEHAVRSLPTVSFKRHRETVALLRTHVKRFRAPSDPPSAYLQYRHNMRGWLTSMGELIREELLPAPTTEFGKLMRRLETKQHTDGTRDGLLIQSSDFAIPWWLANAYSNPNESLSTVMPCGFLPRTGSAVNIAAEYRSRTAIALLSRPTYDLQKSPFIREFLMPEISQLITVVDGEDNARSRGPGFGLHRDTVLRVAREADVVFYYGHFTLDDANQLGSYFEVRPKYLAGLTPSEAKPEPLASEEFADAVAGKFTFINACQSIGLPDTGDDPYPDSESLLISAYLSRKIQCLGTVYPIFDDAAAEYMIHFARALIAGNTFGQSTFAAQNALRAKLQYDAFDWSPYILLGSPDTRVRFDRTQKVE